MIRLSNIALIVVSLLLSLASLSASEQEILLTSASTSGQQQNSKHTEELHSYSLSPLGITTTHSSTHSITPLSRTLPRSLRISERTSTTARAISAIDSTMAASRYGMYNHKILFVSHPRHYYLSRYVRLVI